MSEIVNIDEKLKNCDREFCVDIPDCDCESCSFNKKNPSLRCETHGVENCQGKGCEVYTDKPMSEQKRLDRPDREIEDTIDTILNTFVEHYVASKKEYGTWQTAPFRCKILALIPDIEEHWIDIPDRAGEYWLSAFYEGKHIQPRIISVIDYQRPDRGLEVQYDFPRDTIPVKLFCEEYYPRAKWLFVNEPNWQALKGEE